MLYLKNEITPIENIKEKINKALNGIWFTETLSGHVTIRFPADTVTFNVRWILEDELDNIQGAL